jgi:mRNA-degrading endonuclease HigB of HigAB toxin-antitoxin module
LRVGRAAPPILRGLRVVFNISGNNYRLALQESISRGKKRP